MEFKGQIKGFPVEVVELMMVRQKEQYNEPNYHVFELNRMTVSDRGGLGHGGFDWCFTIEGYCWWEQIIRDKNFVVFFSKYPKGTSFNKS